MKKEQTEKKSTKKVGSRVKDKLEKTIAELIPDILKEAQITLPLKKMIDTPEWTSREMLISDSIADLIKVLRIALDYPARDEDFNALLRAIHYFTMKILIGFHVKSDKLVDLMIKNNEGRLYEDFIMQDAKAKLYVEQIRRAGCLERIKGVLHPHVKDVDFLSHFLQ